MILYAMRTYLLLLNLYDLILTKVLVLLLQLGVIYCPGVILAGQGAQNVVKIILLVDGVMEVLVG